MCIHLILAKWNTDQASLQALWPLSSMAIAMLLVANKNVCMSGWIHSTGKLQISHDIYSHRHIYGVALDVL